ncbi:MAG: endopeptidase La [Clostridia bacterium]
MNKRYLTLKVGKVIFPNSVGIVEFSDAKTIELIKDASSKNQKIILVPKDNKGSALDEGDIGIKVEIEQFLASPFDFEAKLAYKANDIIRITELETSGETTESAAEPLIYEEGNYTIVRSLFAKAKEMYEDYMRMTESSPIPLRLETVNSDINNIVAKIPMADRFAFFKNINTEERLLLFIKTLSEAIAIQEIDESVAQKVKEAIDLNQREYYVREQIKALSSEIEDEDESEEYYIRIDALNAPDEVKEKLRREVRRTKRTAQASPEMAIIKNYLDTVLELPWGIYTEDNDDLKAAEDVLNQDHYGLEKVKERLIEALAVRKLSKDGRSPIICLVGPPGIGKTSIATSIARAMNKNYVRLSFGGVRDEAEIRGHRKTYIGSMPGRIITSIKTAGSMNPVFLMDEIDKMASDYKGDPASALLEVLDPEQNVNFRDHFVELPFDLSKVLFITTANTLDTISRPLLDRMEIIEMTGYTEQEKVEIAKRHLIRKAEKQNGIDEGWVRITDDGIEAIITGYTRESGVRALEKNINAVMRKIARKRIDTPDSDTVIVTKVDIADYLGEVKYLGHAALKDDQVGVVTGLAWTQVGGDTLSIEVMVTPGKGELVLTGSLGDVMKESAKIAVSYCRSIAGELGVESSFFKENDIHIHVPEGATPKDGPSAGITIATALTSALSKRKVNRKVAMTGELTLRGNVLPIGGLKEKTLAAVRAGIEKVFLPEENRKDYRELPDTVKEKLEFVFVDNVKNAILGSLL